MRIVLGLEYDGSRFRGWQTQPDRSGVQDALEHALAIVAGTPVRCICAGRTDAGVHATAQVVHFDAPYPRPLSAWTRGLNALLPATVGVTWARAVSDGFHARFDALERTYRYILLPRHERPGLLHGRVGWWHGSLDVDAMRAAAQAILGTHDFSAFRAAQCQSRSPVRVLRRLDINEEGPFVVFEFAANAFLHHMVRNLVGSLVYVGAARKPTHWLSELLAGRDRRWAAPTFAPDGLYLTAVAYPAELSLPPTPVCAPLPPSCA
ncbi:MAG: tRNA pseudouridine(38-40) synthase TruA [Betaproteobacteria bacterium]|jgi:tRNA pseudouridine38-40 synthase